MNLVFVNYSPPQVKHVSGVRLWNFGRALAKRGHRVIVLTSDRGAAGQRALPPAALPSNLRQHDWTEPVHLMVPEPPQRWLQGVANGTLPRALRAVVIPYSYLARGGMFFPWVIAARPAMDRLAREFRPDFVWGTFGNTDSLVLSRDLAQSAGCLWGFDIKDPWDNFVPAAFRRLLARRFRTASLRTANGKEQARRAERWFGPGFETIYSGFWKREVRSEEPGKAHERRIQFFGHVAEVWLNRFVGWWQELAGRGQLDGTSWTVAYAGEKVKLFRRAWASLGSGPAHLETEAYLPLEDLMEKCRHSSVNAYTCDLGSNPIHHKSIELLAHRRPVLVIPGESPEITRIYREVGLPLLAIDSARALGEALSAIGSAKDPEYPADAVRAFTWEAQARVLEVAIQRTLDCSTEERVSRRVESKTAA